MCIHMCVHVNMYILCKQMDLRCGIVDQKADMGENLGNDEFDFRCVEHEVLINIYI